LTGRRILILGGARSGKSTYAERLAAECGEPVLYVATATALDDEMAERIRLHRARRPANWRTLESPDAIAAPLSRVIGDARTVLIEDLTLLLSNLMLDRPAADAEAQALDEIDALAGISGHLIVVSNEVGMGIVPATPLGRVFRDALGRLNQHAAARVEEVYVLFAGLPLRLK
jgi:adenosylcobinamide kinase/adenosylcobinamide-phosphate guanylyltransferase